MFKNDSYYSNGRITLTQNQESGMTRIMAGIISAIGNIFSFTIRKPVASIRKPPQALKSAIISGVVSGTMKADKGEKAAENDKLWNGNK